MPAAHPDLRRVEPRGPYVPIIHGLSSIHAVILGVVEGLTEFLPISSTGHLTVVERLLGVGTGADKSAADTFTIAVQMGAILAVVALYRSRLVDMARGLLGRDPAGLRLTINVAVAFLPAAVVGFLLEQPIKDHLFGVWPVVIAWAVGGLALIAWSDRLATLGGAVTTDTITLRMSLIIGAAQAIALWPGMSRSLVTIVAAILVGLSMPAAVEFSFILGAVTLTAATLFDLAKHGQELVDTFGVATPLLGFVVAFASGLGAVYWMIRYLQGHSLKIFGWYRLGVAVVTIGLVLSGVIPSGAEPELGAAAPSCSSGVGADHLDDIGGVHVFIHLPACYAERPDIRYPVVYLLHGSNTDHTQWVDIGATRVLDDEARRGRVGEAIVVAPDLGARASSEIADLLTTTIVPSIDARYRTEPDGLHRTVAGISRGGGGALLAAADHPDEFGAVAGHSPAVADWSTLAARLGSTNAEVWLDVGHDDGLRSKVIDLGQRLRSAGVHVDLSVPPGRHDRSYWRTQMPGYVGFWAGRWR